MGIIVTVLEPKSGSKFTYQRIAASASGAPQRRLSFKIEIRNTGSSAVRLERIDLNGKRIDERLLGDAGVTLLQPSGSATGDDTLVYQNFLGAVEMTDAAGRKRAVSWDDVAFADEPSPNHVLLTVAARDTSTGEVHKDSETIELAEHTNGTAGLAFPGIGDVLGVNECFSTSSHHGADHQVFALDVGVLGWSGSAWTDQRSGSTAYAPQDYRIYGMPLFAVADGTVGFVVNDQPEWKTLKDDQVDEATNMVRAVSPTHKRGYGAGNCLYVISGNEVWLCAHMQTGSIPPELTKVGADVKKGQYIGKVGFSGTGSHPHFHVHVKSRPADVPTKDSPNLNGCEKGPYRPMGFEKTKVLPLSHDPSPFEKQHLTDPAKASKAKWTTLSNQSAPHAHSFIVSGDRPPTFSSAFTDATPHIGVWHASREIDLTVTQRGFSAFTSVYSRLAASGFILIALDSFVENGDPNFIGIFRRRQVASQFLSQIAPWESFVSDCATRVASGMELNDVCSFVEGKTRWFVGVYTSGKTGGVPVRTTGIDTYSTLAAQQRKQGRELLAVDAYRPVTGGESRFLWVFRSSAERSDLISAGSWDSFVDQVFEACAGYKARLADVTRFSGGTMPTSMQRYAGIVRPDKTKSGQLIGGHGSGAQLRRESELRVHDGWRLSQVHVG